MARNYFIAKDHDAKQEYSRKYDCHGLYHTHFVLAGVVVTTLVLVLNPPTEPADEDPKTPPLPDVVGEEPPAAAGVVATVPPAPTQEPSTPQP
jgi:hypothetical protein